MEKELYDENVEYCKYVSRKNDEYELDLSTEDIQEIANQYVIRLDDDGTISYGDDESVVENDKLLLEIVRNYKIEAINDQEEKENLLSNDSYLDVIEAEEEAKAREKHSFEEAIHKNGGHGISEAYDDQGIDDRLSQFGIK